MSKMNTDLGNPRIGLFGGTFNPLHMGHINSMLSISEQVGLDKVFAIPTSQNPLKNANPYGPSPKQRLEMVRRGLSDYSLIDVDDQEVERGGKSYTVDTITKYAHEYSSDDLYLIVGADEFAIFDQWKDFVEILSLANLVVTSRPGESLPKNIESLPAGIQKMVAAFDANYIELSTERNIQFIELRDKEIDISATEIRKRLRTGKNVDKFLPLQVENFIKEEGLYKPKGDPVEDYGKLTEFAGDVLFARKGIMVRGFDLTELEAPTEYTLIASGTSTRHTQALSEHVVKAIKDEFGVNPISIEGKDEGHWVLLDYGSLIVHLFYDYVRNEYRLEELWRDGKDLRLMDPAESQ